MILVNVQALTNKDPSGFLALTRKGRACTRKAKNPDGFFAFTMTVTRRDRTRNRRTGIKRGIIHKIDRIGVYASDRATSQQVRR